MYQLGRWGECITSRLSANSRKPVASSSQLGTRQTGNCRDCQFQIVRRGTRCDTVSHYRRTPSRAYRRGPVRYRQLQRPISICSTAVHSGKRCRIVVSSVGRQKNSKGSSTYAADSLNLASFKESGELEFGADDAFILAPVGGGQVKLSHLKARHRRPEDVLFLFDVSTQSFDPITEDGTTLPEGDQ